MCLDLLMYMHIYTHRYISIHNILFILYLHSYPQFLTFIFFIKPKDCTEIWLWKISWYKFRWTCCWEVGCNWAKRTMGTSISRCKYYYLDGRSASLRKHHY